MKQPRKTGAILDLEVVPYGIHLRLYNDKRRFLRAFKSIGHGTLTAAEMGDTRGMTVTNAHYRPAEIWLGVFERDTDFRADVLVHELTHVLEHICARVGIPAQASNSEPRAYLMGYMFRQCINALIAHSFSTSPTKRYRP